MEKEEISSGPQIPTSGRIVPLSERQQMALLKKIEDKRKLQLSLKCQTDPQNKKAFNKLNKRNDRGETALHRGTIKGDHKKVVELLGQGADVNAKDYAGWTALHEACNHGYLEIVRTLIEHGADVSVKGLDGDTPLHDAAVNGHEEITIALIQSGANPEAENDKKETPLEVAEDAETRRLLLEGIPIFREYEKTRKKTLQSLQAAKSGNFADCLTTEGDEKPTTTSPRKRSDSVFSAEEGLTTSETKPTQAPVAAAPVTATSTTESSAMAKDKKERKKKEEKERDEAEERKQRKLKKKAEREKAHREALEAGHHHVQRVPETLEERDKRWTEEIMKKVTQEAESKNLHLTPEQFKKVVERRIQKRKERHQNKALARQQQNAAMEKAKKLKEEKAKLARQKAAQTTAQNGEALPKREKFSSSGSTDLKTDGEGTPKKKQKCDKSPKKEQGRKPSLKFDCNFLDQVDLLKKSKESLKAHKKKQTEIRDRDQKRYKELQRLKELDQAKRSEFKALSDSNVQDKRIGDKRPRLSSTNEFVATPKKPKVDDTRTSANIASGSTFTPIVPKKIDVQQTITEKSCITQFQPNTVSVTEPVDAVSRDEPTFHYTENNASLPRQITSNTSVIQGAENRENQPVSNGFESRRISVIHETPLIQERKSNFKPKFKWLTERGHDELDKQIVTRLSEKLKITTFKHQKLADSSIEQWSKDTPRRSVEDQSNQLNDLDERNCINVRIQKNWSNIQPVIPDAPHNVENFKILSGEYHLGTSVQDRAQFKKLAPPPELPPKMQALFKSQENTRWEMEQQLIVVLEKLRLSYEQRIMRCMAEAKRQELGMQEYSATAFIKQMNFDNQYELPAEDKNENIKDNRNRYTPRVLKQMLDDAHHDFKLKQNKVISRFQMDRECCYMLQVTDWQLRAQQVNRDTAPKTIYDVSEKYVPRIPVIEETDLSIY